MDVFPSGHDQGRSIITVTGDIDLGTAENLLARITALIGSARRGIDLDLSEVTFIDCAGLRTLNAIDARVRANGATTRLTAMSPAVVRLFELAYAIRDPAVPATTPTTARGPAYAAPRPTATPGQAAANRRDCAAAA
jgi:anti-anti-sigma factor